MTGIIGCPNPPPAASKPWHFCGGSISKSGNSLNRDFKEFLGLLLEETVEFALVGGFAVAYHGYPRFTGDMDILIARDEGNAGKVLRVLQRFGFGSLRISAEDLTAEANVIQLGFPPVRIDLITSVDGVENGEIFAGRIIDDFYGLKIPIISLEHLKRNKRATGRMQDLLDLQNLP
jgi:hypothetical protein